MAKVLGLSFFYHDSAAAIVVDGVIVAAASEERFSRRKHTNDFPKLAIEYCLQEAQVSSINDIDAIVFYEKPVIKFQRLLETMIATWPRSLFSFARKFPPFLKNKFNVLGTIRSQLPGFTGQILFSEHHMSHAAAAFYCSPFEEAAILTVDGVGEWETTTIGKGSGKKIELTKALHFPHSVGLLYASLTSYLGFKVNDGEWKVMGLAPYGKPTYVDAFRRMIEWRDDGSFALDMDYFTYHYSTFQATRDKRWEKLFGFPRRDPSQPLEARHSDLARSGQQVVEELILSLAREARKISGSENLVIAGGVGLNGVANSRIEKEKIFKNVWIHPAPGDEGAALGAALLGAYQVFNENRRAPLENAYLGPAYDDQEIEMFLKNRNIKGERLDSQNLVEKVATLLAAGKVVGWFQGRMEFGPRALGARSILADARNPRMKEILNEKIKYRESFRPFAPIIPLEDAQDYFALEPGQEYPFMIKVVPVLKHKQDEIPAVTHEDGSARLQTVTEKSNLLLHKLLLNFKSKTGVPILVNTSFNVRGEPIVCGIEDAYRCFIQTGIDVLVLGSYLILEKPERALSPREGFTRSDELELVKKNSSSPKIDKDSLLLPPEAKNAPDEKTKDQVLRFYQMLPFNVYSNSIDHAKGLLKTNPLKSYGALDKYLREQSKSQSILDVGCGSGWFANASAHYYGAKVIGIDMNPVVLRQARSVVRFLKGAQQNQFIEKDLFTFSPESNFDVVNSLGVLHHTADCHEAIRRLGKWVKPGGFFHLGLYHRYGREPFLNHFRQLTEKGAAETELFEEFRRLNPEMTDKTHLLSWFRDQVLHPHETQHTFSEIQELLRKEGFTITATSLNGFEKMPSQEKLLKLEKTYTVKSEKALHQGGRYFPGFFIVWAQKTNY